MQNPKPSSKMFLDIVGELRSIIKEEGIETGGKLPSERELAERLQAGRSTIREALRSLELLGLIETRRGEGTFLAISGSINLLKFLQLSSCNNQIPSSMCRKQGEFMKQRQFLQYVRTVHYGHYLFGKVCLMKIEEDGEIFREDIIREMIVATGNRLSLKIWFLLKQYSKVPFSEMTKTMKMIL